MTQSNLFCDQLKILTQESRLKWWVLEQLLSAPLMTTNFVALASEITISISLYLVFTWTETNNNLAKRRPCGHHQQFPLWNWGKDWNSRPQQMGTVDWDSSQMGNYGLNHLQFPMLNLRTEPRARGLGSKWNRLLAQADLPWTGKPVRSGVWCKESRA